MMNLFQSDALPASIESLSLYDNGGRLYTHAIESELLAPPPRSAHFATSTIWLRRLFWNLIFATLLAGVFFGRRDLASWDDLLQRGVSIQGSVTNKYINTVKSRDHYHLQYAFQAPDADCAAEMEVSSDEYDTARIGEPIPITYLPGSQGNVWREGPVTPTGRSDREQAWIFATLGMTTLLGGIFAGCSYEWNLQLRLLTSGTAVVGAVESGKVIRAKSTSYQLRYRYPTGCGTSQVSDIYVDQATYRRYTEGNPLLTVVYDTAIERTNRVYSKMLWARLDTRDLVDASGVMPVYDHSQR